MNTLNHSPNFVVNTILPAFAAAISLFFIAAYGAEAIQLFKATPLIFEPCFNTGEFTECVVGSYVDTGLIWVVLSVVVISFVGGKIMNALDRK